MSKLPINQIINGDCLQVMRGWPEKSINCCVTSPPYWGLRDYGAAGQIGLESTPEEFIAKMVEVFREVRRVLRDDGTLWLNLGDSYNSGTQFNHHSSGLGEDAARYSEGSRGDWPGHRVMVPSLKPKDLCGIPWRVALALQADGWYLRQDIIWHKPNPMPESVTDRCTKAHEYIFLMTKSQRYWYDADAIKEPCVESNASRPRMGQGANTQYNQKRGEAKHRQTDPQASGHRMVDNVQKARDAGNAHDNPFGETRNKRSVWTVPTKPFSESAGTDHWQRVEQDEVCDGTMHIVSPNCPTCGDSFVQASTVSCDGRASDLLNRIWCIYTHPVFSQVPDFSQSGLPHDSETWLRNLGSLAHKCFLSATGRNIESRKMALCLSTNPSCTPVVETLSGIDGMLERLLFVVLQTHIRGNNIWPDAMDAHLQDQIPCRMFHKSSLEAPLKTCTCRFYNRITKKSSHFATFPPDLITPCILAGCPQWVCSECGEPRSRITKSELSFQSGSGKSGNAISRKNGADLQGGGETGDIRKGPCRSTETTGWTRCKCNAPFRPGITCDPFMGAFTTALVAYKHNRNYVGCELSQEYIKLGNARIASERDKYGLLENNDWIIPEPIV